MPQGMRGQEVQTGDRRNCPLHPVSLSRRKNQVLQRTNYMPNILFAQEKLSLIFQEDFFKYFFVSKRGSPLK